jgi:hypothetical protein
MLKITVKVAGQFMNVSEYIVVLLPGMFGNVYLYLVSLQQACCKTPPHCTFRCDPTTSSGTTDCIYGSDEPSGEASCSQDRDQWNTVGRPVVSLQPVISVTDTNGIVAYRLDTSHVVCSCGCAVPVVHLLLSVLHFVALGLQDPSHCQLCET